MDAKHHWEDAYTRLGFDRVGWTRPRLDASLRLIGELELPADGPILDVGGGAATLVDHLLDAGHTDLTVLDIAATALSIARDRLGSRAAAVRWIAGDVLGFELPRSEYAVWHDRAVFHFLVEPSDRLRYRDQLLAALRPDGHLIIGAFDPAAPERCSGLPVRRATPEQLQRDFEPELELVTATTEQHRTPGGTDQPYVYCRFDRRG